MHVHLLTCKELPDLSPDDKLWRDYLQQRGHKVTVGIWGEDFDYSKDTVAVIRSCWDYIDRVDEFCRYTWNFPCKLFNNRNFIAWNVDKLYLFDFERESIDIVPTYAYGAVPDCEKVVVKPRYSNAGKNIFVMQGSKLREPWVRVSDQYIVQPFIDEIKDGEISCIFIGGILSHCVKKVPSEGEFRVQHFYGGQYSLYNPTYELMETAYKCQSILHKDCLYSRFDFIPCKGKWLLSECEVIEPWLHFDLYPAAIEKITLELEKRHASTV